MTQDEIKEWLITFIKNPKVCFLCEFEDKDLTDQFSELLDWLGFHWYNRDLSFKFTTINNLQKGEYESNIYFRGNKCDIFSIIEKEITIWQLSTFFIYIRKTLKEKNK